MISPVLYHWIVHILLVEIAETWVEHVEIVEIVEDLRLDRAGLSTKVDWWVMRIQPYYITIQNKISTQQKLDGLDCCMPLRIYVYIFKNSLFGAV